MKTRAWRTGAGPLWSRSWLLALAILIGLAGCGDTSAQTAPLQILTATPVSSKTPINKDAKPLSLQQAWGSVTVRHLPIVVGNNQYFVFDSAATPDGQNLIGVIQPRTFPQNGNLPSYIALYNIETQQLTRLQQLQTPQSQVIGASADNNWVVWEKANDQPNFFNWVLFAYNRQTGQVQRLGQAVKGADGNPVAGPFSGPVVDGGHVIWSQPIGAVGPGSLNNAVVRMEDLASNQVTTLATGAGNVALSWPWASWAQTGANQTGFIVFHNMLTGQTLQLASQTSYLALAGTSIAYAASATQLVMVDDITKGISSPQQILTVQTPEDLEYVTISNHLVGWVDINDPNVGAEVYDRQLHRLVDLPVANGGLSSSWTGGHLLVWVASEPQSQVKQDEQAHLAIGGTFNVIDTNTLPTSAS